MLVVVRVVVLVVVLMALVVLVVVPVLLVVVLVVVLLRLALVRADTRSSGARMLGGLQRRLYDEPAAHRRPYALLPQLENDGLGVGPEVRRCLREAFIR